VGAEMGGAVCLDDRGDGGDFAQEAQLLERAVY